MYDRNCRSPLQHNNSQDYLFEMKMKIITLPSDWKKEMWKKMWNSSSLSYSEQQFIVLLYDRTSSQESVNRARQYLFTRKNRQMENLPPTTDALYQHVLRAALQAGHVWAQSLVLDPILPSPEDFGWKKADSKWEVRTHSWCSLPFSWPMLFHILFHIPFFQSEGSVIIYSNIIYFWLLGAMDNTSSSSSGLQRSYKMRLQEKMHRKMQLR